MSKKSWYKRSHQFTPYTKADGQAVSDEFDSIQASFERIPEMRDDGKGFAVSPLIPKPTDPNHPVTLGMLTESEKSVNTARDDVNVKAKQVAQAAQAVETNTQIAINKADSATQSAASALGSSQSAGNSEVMARKWASNPVDQLVFGDKYSAFHYATKAASSAENLSSAERSAKNNADIAAQKAEEARKSAEKAKSLAAGEVEYSKILNVPRASTSTEGVVRLTNDTGLDSEVLGLTAKAGKVLSQAIATVHLSLNNYIPLNKRSSVVNSNNKENVATSAAVKTAYDKAIEAKEAADTAQRTAKDANNNADTRVSKAGDTMTGYLNVPLLIVKKIHAWLSIFSTNKDTASIDFGVNTNSTTHVSIAAHQTASNGVEVMFFTSPEDSDHQKERRVHTMTVGYGGHLWSKAYGWFHDVFHMQLKPYVTVTEGTNNLAGVDIRRNDGKLARIELFNKRWKFWLQDKYEIFMPEKGGTVALVEDFTYQKIGNFEIHRYPNGMMIQTYIVDVMNITVGRITEFNWAVSFVDIPFVSCSLSVFKLSALTPRGQLRVNLNDHLSSGSKFVFSVDDIFSDRKDGLRIKFFGIGRWK